MKNHGHETSLHENADYSSQNYNPLDPVGTMNSNFRNRPSQNCFQFASQEYHIRSSR
jgi:hypothetical protein